MPENPHWAEIRAHLAKYPPTQAWDRLHQFVPDPAERKAYLDEVTLGKSSADLQSSYIPVTRDFFVTNFERLNFFSPDSQREYGQLEAAVDRNVVPWVPLGSTDNAVYRLHPEFDGFLPHGKATRQSLPLEFLGVNTNVAPQTGSRRTADSAKSDDVGDDCFVAHQLGELMSWSRDKNRLCPSEEGGKYKNLDIWEKTGFFVITQLSSSGIAERLCLVVDSFPQLEDGSRPLSTTTPGDVQNHSKSNFRAPDSRALPCSFQDRSFDTPFALEAVHEYPVELVHLKKANVGDRFIPETVHHEKGEE